MRVNRILLSAALVVVALVVQVSVLARLHLPGAVPDLLLLTVLGLALVYGHVGGALVGFCAGLLADLAPPADHAVGRYALVLCVIGYARGPAKPDNGRLRSGDRARCSSSSPPPSAPPCCTPASAPSSATPPPATSASPSLLFTRRPLRPAAGPVHRPAGHGAGPARRQRPAGRDRHRRRQDRGDIASGWLTTGTGLRIGSQRGGLGGLKVRAARRPHAPASAASRGSSGCDRGKPAAPAHRSVGRHHTCEGGAARREQHPRDRPDPPGHRSGSSSSRSWSSPCCSPSAAGCGTCRSATATSTPRRPRATTSSRSSSPPSAARSSTRAECRSPTTRPGWSSPPAAPTC